MSTTREQPLTESDLVGAWLLRSVTRRRPDGRQIQSMSASPHGMLTYTADGCVQAFGAPETDEHFDLDLLGMDDLPRPRQLGRLVRQLPSVLAFLRKNLRSFAYCGTYRLDGDEVVHDVLSSTHASREGTTLRRKVRLDQHELTLAVALGDDERLVLVWDRADPNR